MAKKKITITDPSYKYTTLLSTLHICASGKLFENSVPLSKHRLIGGFAINRLYNQRLMPQTPMQLGSLNLKIIIS